jgi:hypothetical protein
MRAMRPLTETEKAALERIEHLPDNAAIPLKLCALLSGNSDRSWRRNPPVPTFFVSPGKRAANLGLVRKLVRGELASPNAA